MDKFSGFTSCKKEFNYMVYQATMTSEIPIGEKSDIQGSFLWNDSHFSFRFIPTAELCDSYILFPNPNVLLFIQGYVSWEDTGVPLVSHDANCQAARLSQLAYDLCNDRQLNEINKLDGSFLIIIYDSSTTKLIFVSDRIASRPLFFSAHKNGFSFANDILSLLQDSEVAHELDNQSIVEFLRFTMVFGERTLYKHISCLPPASILTNQGNKIGIKQYWTPRCREEWNKPDSYYIESLANYFQSACSRLIDTPGSTALMLSGGLDSRMIAAALSSIKKPIRTITFGGFRNDEVKLAERVAKACGFSYNFIHRGPGYYRDILQTAAQISNGIYSFDHAHMLGVHNQVRALGINTLIHGWGLDLLFSASYLPKRVVHHLPGRSFGLLWPRLLVGTSDVAASLYSKLALPNDDLTDRLMSNHLSAEWREWPREIIRTNVEHVATYTKDPYNQHDLVIFKDFAKFRSFLYPLSVRWGTRERCPLFDNHLMDLFLEMPPRLRFCSRAYGQALNLLNKDLAHLPYSRTGVNILAPEIIQTVSYFLLPSIYRLRLGLRRLVGTNREYVAEFFQSYPDISALMRNTPLLDDLQQDLGSNGFFDLGIVNPDVVSIMIEKHKQGTADYAEYLAGLLTLSNWQSWGEIDPNKSLELWDK